MRDQSCHLQMELVQYGAGQYFGEAALINDAPRSATVQAVTDCELARIDKKTFVRLLGAVDGLKFREYPLSLMLP
jgi:cAMP-dependent protein kinase regulator